MLRREINLRGILKKKKKKKEKNRSEQLNDGGEVESVRLTGRNRKRVHNSLANSRR